MMEALHYEFVRTALVAAVLAGIACGVVGTFVVVKRIVFLSGGIAHAAFGGIGLGYFLGVGPLTGLLPFSVLAALGIGWISRRGRVSEDTAIGVFWAAGMALGVVFVGLTPGYAPDLFSYLFGSILTVAPGDLRWMAALDAGILLVTALGYKEFLALAFDEEYAEAAGVPVGIFSQILLILVALTVVLLVQVAGLILVIALLTIPAATAAQHTTRLPRMMAASVILAILVTVAGLAFSYRYDIASGAAIVLTASGVFLVASIFRPRRS